MAVTATKSSTKLVLNIKTGVGTDGKDILKSMSFSKIKAAAADDALLATAKAIEPLLNYPIASIEKNDAFSLIEA